VDVRPFISSRAASFTEEQVQVEGVVLDYVFRNPHVIVYLNAIDDEGDEVRWMVQGSTATSFSYIIYIYTLVLKSLPKNE
jgi:hypothetical protein